MGENEQPELFHFIIHKPGVFSFGLNYGHATLQLGDGTQFHDLPAMTLPAVIDDSYVNSAGIPGSNPGDTIEVLVYMLEALLVLVVTRI